MNALNNNVKIKNLNLNSASLTKQQLCATIKLLLCEKKFEQVEKK